MRIEPALIFSSQSAILFIVCLTPQIAIFTASVQMLPACVLRLAGTAQAAILSPHPGAFFASVFNERRGWPWAFPVSVKTALDKKVTSLGITCPHCDMHFSTADEAVAHDAACPKRPATIRAERLEKEVDCGCGQFLQFLLALCKGFAVFYAGGSPQDCGERCVMPEKLKPCPACGPFAATERDATEKWNALTRVSAMAAAAVVTTSTR